MAGAEEEIEYESDPEEAKLSMKLRRRAEASDDEADEGGEIRGKSPRGTEDDYDGESEGAVAEYEDDSGNDYDVDEEYLEGMEEVEYDDEESGSVEGAKAVAVGRGGSGEYGSIMEEQTRVNDVAGEINEEILNTKVAQVEGEKKEVEPYSVPTAGAFYMHDDRFRDTAGGRNRRMLGGRKLWESKDDRKWGHDKFEELASQGRTHEEKRMRGPRGRNRGRGRGRNQYAQENRSRELSNNGSQSINNQESAPKSFRGRGPRRYQPSSQNAGTITQNKQQLWKSKEKPAYVGSEKNSKSMSSAGPEAVISRKQVRASSLNIASPPFYPSGSSTRDRGGPSKELRPGAIKYYSQPPAIGIDKLYIDDSLSASSGKPANTVQVPLSGQSSVNSGRERGAARLNKDNRINYANQLQTVQGNHGQNHGQSSVQFTPRGSQASSPPETSGTVSAVESLEAESIVSKIALGPQRQGNTHGSEKGPLYGGAHVMGASGNMGSGHGDKNFPAFLPVMQFGAQHPGGIGVPAVGMAFPGYVGQPQLGRGSSEMTWLPILTGPAGALGARYGPPFAVDGSYQARPSGQTSSVKAASSNEHNTTNATGKMDSAEGPELENNDYGQRQKNSRRYTEMKFDQ